MGDFGKKYPAILQTDFQKENNLAKKYLGEKYPELKKKKFSHTPLAHPS